METTKQIICKVCSLVKEGDMKFKGHYCRACYNIRQKTVYYEKLKPLHQKYYLEIRADPEKLKKYNENHVLYYKKKQLKKQSINNEEQLINISIQGIINNERAIAEIEKMNLLYPN